MPCIIHLSMSAKKIRQETCYKSHHLLIQNSFKYRNNRWKYSNRFVGLLAFVSMFLKRALTSPALSSSGNSKLAKHLFRIDCKTSEKISAFSFNIFATMLSLGAAFLRSSLVSCNYSSPNLTSLKSNFSLT